jgi:hypothetical protein
MRRQPAVAGQFYSSDPVQLRKDLSSLIEITNPKKKTPGIISPHAGFVYSGSVAGKIFGQIDIPQTVLIIGPNHRGSGEPAALYPDGEWLTPFGSVAINSHLNQLIKQHTPFVQFDTVAHEFEHSLEVQLPFIQYLRPDVTISALCLGHGDYRSLHEIGVGIADAISAYGEDVLIVASSDMTHYESAESARHKDNMALNHVLALDPEGLLNICRSEHITMCGVVPAAVMMVAVQQVGTTAAEIVAYSTSGDVSGDNSKVVAYAAVVFT